MLVFVTRSHSDSRDKFFWWDDPQIDGVKMGEEPVGHDFNCLYFQISTKEQAGQTCSCVEPVRPCEAVKMLKWLENRW